MIYLFLTATYRSFNENKYYLKYFIIKQKSFYETILNANEVPRDRDRFLIMSKARKNIIPKERVLSLNSGGSSGNLLPSPGLLSEPHLVFGPELNDLSNLNIVQIRKFLESTNLTFDVMDCDPNLADTNIFCKNNRK